MLLVIFKTSKVSSSCLGFSLADGTSKLMKQPSKSKQCHDWPLVGIVWNVKSNQDGVHDGSILVFALVGFKGLRKKNSISLDGYF
jgi:hypothetical protein